MAKLYSTLRAKKSPESRVRAEGENRQLMQEMLLQELRQARMISQEQLAKILNTQQSCVSRLESRSNMYISTLREVIKAMGGHLEIVAKFPNGHVRISQFEDLDHATIDG
jgi:ribosome-binding protein aMBF1 (putative translation factor)